MRSLLIFFLLITFSNANISIENAWKKVLLLNEGLKASNADVLYADELNKATNSFYLPELNLNASYTRLEKDIQMSNPLIPIQGLLGTFVGKPIPMPDKITLQEKDIFSSSLSLLWPIYTGGKIDAASDLFKAKKEEAQAKYKLNKDKVFLKLIKSYYGVLLAKELLNTREEARSSLELHLNNSKILKSQGQIASIDLLNAKVKLDSANIENTKAKHKYEITKLSLKNLINSNDLPSSSLFISSKIEDKEVYEKQMLDSYSALDIIKAKQKQVDSNILIKKSEYFPKIVAFGNYTLYKDDSINSQSKADWNAGLALKFNLFSRKGKAENLKAARIMKSRLSYTLNQSKSDLSLLIEKTYKEMLQFKSEYEDLDSSLSLAHENLRLRSLAFKEGISTSIEVVDAQTFLTAAKTKRLNAIYNYVKKVSQLCVLSGTREMFFKLQSSSMEIK